MLDPSKVLRKEPRVKRVVVFDVLSLFLIVTSFMLFAYVTTFVDILPILAVKGLVGGILMVGALVMITIPDFGVGYYFDKRLSLDELGDTLLLTTISIVAIGAVNYTVFEYVDLAVLPIQRAIFAMIIGVSEELLFRGYLLTLASNYSDDLTALFVSSLIGATFHIGVYGARSFAVLLVVAGSFLVLGIVWIMSEKTVEHQGRAVKGRRVLAPMLAHIIVNLVAYLR